MIKIGSRVMYIGDPRNLTGTVKDLHWEQWLNVATHATVEWDDENLAPRQMRVAMVELKLHEETSVFGLTINDCECGLKYISGGEHSNWCKLYGKGIYPWNS